MLFNYNRQQIPDQRYKYPGIASIIDVSANDSRAIADSGFGGEGERDTFHPAPVFVARFPKRFRRAVRQAAHHGAPARHFDVDVVQKVGQDRHVTLAIAFHGLVFHDDLFFTAGEDPADVAENVTPAKKNQRDLMIHS